jgi:NitT/TauT family transport system ATP-binding protein
VTRAVSTGRVRIDGVSVRFASDFKAVREATLDVAPGEFVCLLGPSGCGKSTLLNCVAGFIKPTSGTIEVDGQRVERPGPDRGMVFQQYSLFPWKTVKENVAFGPLMAKHGKAEADRRARELLTMVGLGAHENSYPGVLSGGMKQRVGIARALANHPKVLLMDEPFGALDSQTRTMMQENLLQIWGTLGTTVLFVTHDIDEAVFLGDRIIVMSAGPGRLIADIRVELPRPRAPEIVSDPVYVATKRRCVDLIRAESLRAFAQQNGRGVA